MKGSRDHEKVAVHGRESRRAVEPRMQVTWKRQK